MYTLKKDICPSILILPFHLYLCVSSFQDSSPFVWWDPSDPVTCDSFLYWKKTPRSTCITARCILVCVIYCKPTFILHNIISQFIGDKLVCNDLFSWVSLIQKYVVITIIEQGLVCGEKSLLQWCLTKFSRSRIKVGLQCRN